MSVVMENEGLQDVDTLDQLHSESLDHESDKQAAKDLLVPEGSYISQPEVKITVVEDEESPSADGKPRKVALLSGRMTNRESGADERLSFRLSWQRRDDPRKEGKPDSAHKRYLEAKKVFKDVNGEEPKTVGELLSYLANYPFGVRMGQFENDEGETISFVARVFMPRDV